MTGFRGTRSRNGLGVFGMAVLSTLAGACGGGSKASPGSGSAGSAGGGAGAAGGSAGTSGAATQLCSQLISTICMRLKSCALVDATFDEAACERGENVEFGCDRASSAGFPTCLADVKAISCAGLFSMSQGLILPPSCDDPVNTIPLSDPQTKCEDLATADCKWGAACLGITPTAAQLQQCVIDDFAQNNCGFVTAVGATYNQCLADITASPCPPPDGGASDAGADGGGLPSCNTALTYVN